MDTRVYKAKEYHKLVWGKAKDRTESYFRLDTWAWVGGGIAALISGSITAYTQNWLSNAAMIPLWISAVTILAGTVFGLAGFVVVLYGWNGLWYVPAKLYRDRETEAWRSTWKDIDIKPYKFPSDNFGNVVGLEIISDKNPKIANGAPHEFSIEVVKLLIYEFGYGINVKQLTDSEMYLYVTDEIVFHPTTGIQSRRELVHPDNWATKVVLPIAKWDDSTAWIMIKKGDVGLYWDLDNPYRRVVIGFHEWRIDGGDAMKFGCTVTCSLRYTKNEKGQMEVKLEILKRDPNYEK